MPIKPITTCQCIDIKHEVVLYGKRGKQKKEVFAAFNISLSPLRKKTKEIIQ